MGTLKTMKGKQMKIHCDYKQIGDYVRTYRRIGDNEIVLLYATTQAAPLASYWRASTTGLSGHWQTGPATSPRTVDLNRSTAATIREHDKRK